jgi:hypothetical protein
VLGLRTYLAWDLALGRWGFVGRCGLGFVVGKDASGIVEVIAETGYGREGAKGRGRCSKVEYLFHSARVPQIRQVRKTTRYIRSPNHAHM